jgi:hypothetical protein
LKTRDRPTQSTPASETPAGPLLAVAVKEVAKRPLTPPLAREHDAPTTARGSSLRPSHRHPVQRPAHLDTMQDSSRVRADLCFDRSLLHKLAECGLCRFSGSEYPSRASGASSPRGGGSIAGTDRRSGLQSRRRRASGGGTACCQVGQGLRLEANSTREFRFSIGMVTLSLTGVEGAISSSGSSDRCSAYRRAAGGSDLRWPRRTRHDLWTHGVARRGELARSQRAPDRGLDRAQPSASSSMRRSRRRGASA